VKTTLCSDPDYFKVTPDEVKAELGLPVEADKEMTLSELNKKVKSFMRYINGWTYNLDELKQTITIQKKEEEKE
jgi:hypothetical protein